MAPHPFDQLNDAISLNTYLAAERSTNARSALCVLAHDLHLDHRALDPMRDPRHPRWIISQNQVALFRTAHTQIVFAQPGATPEEAARATLAMLRAILTHEPKRSKYRLTLHTHTRQFQLVP